MKKQRRSLLDDIVTGIASGVSTNEIIERTVDRISRDFPIFRVAYSTIDKQGQIRIIRSVEPPGMPKLAGVTADLTVAPQYLSELREGQPVVIEDTTEDPRIAPLADTMTLGHTLALLDVPLAHSDQLVGLLCFDSDRARKWSEYEIETLTEIAQYLSLALRDAHLRRACSEADYEVRTTSLRLHALIENLQTGILLEDSAGRVLYVNSRLSEMLGIGSPSGLIGKQSVEAAEQWKHLFSGPEDHVRRTGEVVSQGHIVRGEALQITDGRTFERGYVPIKFDGETIGSLWTYEDVTERRRLAEQLVLSQKMESLGKFAGGVAHDFNNLLTVIMAFCYMGTSSVRTSSSERGLFLEIEKAAQRATELTEQMLTFSRRAPVEPRVFDLNNLILSVDKMLRRLIGEDIELVTVPSTDLWAVKMDPGQMELVLVNLAANARDAMPSGGKLIIETTNVAAGEKGPKSSSASTDTEYVMLSVTDTGTGVAEDVASRIFEPYFTTKEAGEGSGLGLSICYSIVTQNGGHIEVESAPGHTTLKIYLPRVSVPARPLAEPQRLASLPEGKETVVLVEDEEIVRTVTGTMLDGLGYRVFEMASGHEALRLAQERAGQQIHLLLSDVVMPLMSGSELADRFSALHPETRILFTSGYVQDVSGISEEAEFVKKPFTPSSLAHRVREVLDK